jgi:uncharacterized coiled-coil protein SlyX
MTTARTNTPTLVPGIPKPPGDVSPALRRYLESLSEAVEIRLGRRGDPRDRAITLRELIDSGLASELANRPFNPNSGSTTFESAFDSTVPTVPTGFTATGGYSIVTLFWDYPRYGPHAHTEIWRNSANVIGDAQLVGISSGISFVDPVGEGAAYYYWVRHVSSSEIYGPFNAVNGTLAQTALNVQLLLSELTNSISVSQLTQELASQIDGAGTAADLANLEAFVGYFANYNGSSLKVLVDEANQGVSDLETYTGYVTGYAGSPLRTRITASETAITNLQTTVNDPVTGVSANANALSTLDTRVTATEGSITTQSGQITSINASLTTLSSSTTANTSAISGLTTRVTTTENDVDANTSDITALETTVNHPSTGVAATASGLSSLTTRVTTAEGTITSQGTSITNLQSGLSTANSNISANGSAISGLTTRVTNAEGSISSQGASITSLQSGLSTANTNIAGLQSTTSANASNISSLTTRVTNAEGSITAQASSINTLTTTVSGQSATIQTNTSSINGLNAKYVVKIDNNGAVAGYGLASTANSAGNIVSEFIVNADRFAILKTASDTGTPQVPFIVTTSTQVINGVSVPPGVYIEDAFIRNGTITNAKIGNAAIDDAKIASLSADKIVAGTIDTARLAIDNITLDSYYDSSIARNRLRIRDLGVDTAKINNAAITTAKIGDLAVTTLKIAGNSITQPQTYTAADMYVSSAINVGSGGYVFVGYPNGDYIYEPEFGGYFYVGQGNGDYTYSSGGTISGGHVAIETPQISVGVDSTAAVQIVFYGFCDGSLVNDGGQLLYMFVDKYANGSWSGYQVVATTRVGARTSGGNTQSVFSIAMAHTAADLQSIRVKVLVGSQAVQAALGSPSNPTYLRNITISMLGAKR